MFLVVGGLLMLSKVKKKLRPLMPRPFLTFVRKVRRRSPATSPRRRLTCSLEGGINEIKAKYIQKRWHVRSLVVIVVVKCFRPPSFEFSSRPSLPHSAAIHRCVCAVAAHCNNRSYSL